MAAPTLPQMADWLTATAELIATTEDNDPSADATEFANFIVHAFEDELLLHVAGPPGWEDVVRAAAIDVWEGAMDTKQKVKNIAGVLRAPQGGHRPFPEQFSTPLRKVLKAISIGKPHVVGSAEDHQVMYSADYDLMENVVLKPSSAKTFQTLIRKTQKVATITDIKCGEVKDWNLMCGATYSQKEELEHLGRLWQKGVVTDAEVETAKKLLKPHLSVPEKLRAKKELRFGILRWTPTEVYAGHKTYRKHTFYLEDAFTSTGITKVDAVAWVKDKYVEVSNILLWQKGGKTFAQTKPLKDALAEDIVLYEEEGNWVKVAKRMLSLAKDRHYITDEKKLRQILNSPLGAVYTVVADLEVLEEFPDAVTPKKKREELDGMRDRMAKLFFPDFDHAEDPRKLLPKLKTLLQEETEKQLKLEHLLPLRKDYRPSKS